MSVALLRRPGAGGALRWRRMAAWLLALAVLATAGAFVWRAAQRGAEGETPRDGRGWVLQAYREVEAGRWAEAAVAFERGVSLSRKVASDPAVLCEWADALAMAQGRSLAGRPTELIERALALNAAHPKALEMAGSAAYERRDWRAALGYWKRLQPQLAEGSAERSQLDQAIARTERRAATELPQR